MVTVLQGHIQSVLHQAIASNPCSRKPVSYSSAGKRWPRPGNRKRSTRAKLKPNNLQGNLIFILLCCPLITLCLLLYLFCLLDASWLCSRLRRASHISGAGLYNANKGSSSLEPPAKKMPSGRIHKATAKRIPARASKKDPWDEKQLMTSSKSRLVGIDLVVRA